MTAAVVKLDDVGFRYPASGPPALVSVSLTIDAGERVAVLGPNGSGKTTLALHLNGLLELQTGAISVGDLALVTENLPEIRRRVGTVFQDPDDQLFMNTVADDVAFGPANLGISGRARDDRVTDALAAVDATTLVARSPHRLSGGEKRRVAIATVLAMHPDVLVLDEPTSGLDPLGRRQLAELLVSLPQTQIIVTHDLPFALATCPRAVVLDGGHIVADQPTVGLLADQALLAQHRLELPFGMSLTSRA